MAKLCSYLLTAVLIILSAGFLFQPFSILHAQTHFVKYRSGSPILPLGPAGAWDDTEAAYAHIRFDGEQYQMWYSGSPEFDRYLIGYATSSDGIHWIKHDKNPVFSASASGFDNLDVWQPMVLYNDGHYEMWYLGNATAGDIGYATSDDGISWNRQNNGNPVLTKGASGEWDQDYIAKPFVARNDTLYRIWYAGTVQSPFGIWQTGTAMSTDGINWSKHQDNPVLKAGNQGEWDAGGAVLSGFIVDNGLYHMWYFNWSSTANGLKTGYATSADGLDWTKYEGNPILNQNSGDWDVLSTAVSTVIREGHRWRMWYTGRQSGSVDRLCYAEDFSNAAHTDSIKISPDIVVASDTVRFNAWVANPHSENLTAKVLIMSEGMIVDSADLSPAEDRLWQGSWIENLNRDAYQAAVKLHNISAGYVHNSMDWGVFEKFEVIQSPVPDSAQLEHLAEGLLFAEGPLWHPDGFLLCSDVVGNRIYKIDPQTGAKEIFLSPSGGANGLAFDAGYNLIMCRQDARDLARLESNGAVTVLASQYGGKKFNRPNDLTVRSDGTIFFTDLAYTGEIPPEVDGIYALKPDNELIRLDSTVTSSNGICLSPDEKKLYAASTYSRTVYVFDIEDDLMLTNKKVFRQISTANYIDGMKVDEDGLLYVAALGDGVWILAPNGKYVDHISVPQNVTNLNWGDPDHQTLYITTANSVQGGDGNVYKIRLDTKGFRPDFAPTNVERRFARVPVHTDLFQNYPNPFNPTTTIKYHLLSTDQVELKIYNALGQKIRTLVNSVQSAGTYQAVWNGRDRNGDTVPSGIYFYQLQAGSVVETRKMLLVR